MDADNFHWYRPLLLRANAPHPCCNVCDGRGWDIQSFTGHLEIRACQVCKRYDHKEAALAVIKLGVLCDPVYPHRIEDDDLMQPWESRI